MSTLVTQCSPDGNIPNLNPSEIEDLKSYKSLEDTHQVQIGDSKETGEELWLCLEFVSKSDKSPLKNQEIKLYHTSSEGEYDPADPNDESTAKLQGTAFTNKHGRIYIETILPGAYGSSNNNRHIHTIVKGAKPETYDIHFLQYTDFMGKRFIENSDQHFLAELKYNRDSTLVTFLTIEVKQPVLKD